MGNKVVKDGRIYSEYKDNIKPLDIIFFKGDEFVSNSIRFFQKRRATENTTNYNIDPDAFSHVGLVVTHEILNDHRLVPYKLYIWESTMSGSMSDGVNNIDGQSFFGTQLRDLDEVIKAYDKSKKARIAVGSLKNEIFTAFDLMNLKLQFTALFEKYNNVQYDANLVSVASTIYRFCRCCRGCTEETLNTEEWLFCSEMVALIYVKLGILPKGLNSKNVAPMDFLGFDIDKMLVVVNEPVYVIYK